MNISKAQLFLNMIDEKLGKKTKIALGAAGAVGTALAAHHLYKHGLHLSTPSWREEGEARIKKGVESIVKNKPMSDDDMHKQLAKISQEYSRN